MSSFGIQNLCKTSAYDDNLIRIPTSQWQFFYGGLFQQIIDAFGFRVHTQFKRRVMSGFGTQNLYRVSDYDEKLITEAKN
jgi:hypothetical protein